MEQPQPCGLLDFCLPFNEYVFALSRDSNTTNRNCLCSMDRHWCRGHCIGRYLHIQRASDFWRVFLSSPLLPLLSDLKLYHQPKLYENLIFILALAFAACSAPSQKENSASESKVNEKLEVTAFHAKLNESPGAILLDVRTPKNLPMVIFREQSILILKLLISNRKSRNWIKAKPIWCIASVE